MSAPPRIPDLGRIRAALAQSKRSPSRGLGQHFLADPALLRGMVEAAGLVQGELVLEVGPGPGTLTAALLGAGVRVLAVEFDRTMVEVLERLLGRPAGLEVIRADILAEAPDLPAAVAARLAAEPGGRYALVANLPYGVAATLLLQLLERRPFRCAVVTVQREVADRLVAAPGGKQYGPLGVLAGLRARIELLRRLPPGAFWPAPKVESATLRIEPRPLHPVVTALDAATLSRVVHGAFHARRKLLANSLRLAFPEPAVQEAIETAVAALPGGGKLRAEQCGPLALLELAQRLAPWIEGRAV